MNDGTLEQDRPEADDVGGGDDNGRGDDTEQIENTEGQAHHDPASTSPSGSRPDADHSHSFTRPKRVSRSIRPPSLLSVRTTSAVAPRLTDKSRNDEAPNSAKEDFTSNGLRSQDDKENTTSYAGDFDDEQDESDAEDEDEDEEEDEDPEPSLKYQRLKGSLSDILKKDSVSTFATCEKFLALGTHAGMVFILDFDGNLVKGFKSHSASVLDLDIDTAQEFVAAAGMDGLLSVSALSSAEHYAFDFKRPMRAVSLEPSFGRRNSRAFVCGGMSGALIHREKGWLGHKETVLHAGEGPIWSCQWRGNLIAWANDCGVRIYDTISRQKITFITAPTGQSRGDVYRCNLFWQDDRTLVIAWADQIKIAHVKEKQARNGGGANSTHGGGGSVPGLNLNQTPQLYVQVTKVFELDCLISGIAPYGSDLLVLCYIAEPESDSDSENDDGDDDDSHHGRSGRHKRRLAQRPELRIIDPGTGDEKSSDVLSLSNHERLSCNDYRLVPSKETKERGEKTTSASSSSQPPPKEIFYVVSPHDVILARPRDEKDHIDWLLEHRKYESALHRIEAMGTHAAQQAGFDAQAIGRQWLNYLVDDLGEYKTAAQVGTRILGRDSKAWEEWAFLFLQRGRLEELVDYIPLDDPTLSTDVYDMVLVHFLHANLPKLRELIDAWPPEIYSPQAVSLAIEDRLQTSPTASAQGGVHQPWTVKTDDEQTLLMEVLADLYVRNRQPGKSLPYYLRLKRPGVFDLIRDNNLLLDVRDRARQLIEFEEAVREDSEQSDQHPQPPGQAIQLLVDNVYSIPVPKIVPQLELKPQYLHQYLDALFQTDPQLVAEYSDLQVELYADFDHPRLMHYLRAMSSHYSFEKAFKVCEHHDYIPEQVFLLGRVGDNKRALNLIISRLQDVPLAIEFAKEQNDDELWEDLLRYSESRPDFIRGLLENVGAEIDPVRLIRRVRDGLEIPGLKDALIKTLSDFNLQISLLEGCVGILESDATSLAQRRLQGQSRAKFFDVSDGLHHLHSSGVAENSVCPTCGQNLWRRPKDTYEAARQEHTLFLPRVVFLCGHAYHLACVMMSGSGQRKSPSDVIESLPPSVKKQVQQMIDGGASVEVGQLTTTTTQRVSAARLGLNHLDEEASSSSRAAMAYDEQYGPALRAQRYRSELQRRLAHSNRLKPLIKAQGGCSECSGGDKRGGGDVSSRVRV